MFCFTNITSSTAVAPADQHHAIICHRWFLVEPAQVYDSGNGLLAPRIWWCLSYHGHPAPLILDGGYAMWVKEGRSTDLAEPCPLTASPDLQQWHTGCNIKPASTPLGSTTSSDNKTRNEVIN